MSKQLTLILGGIRSGKSSFAQELASSGERILFLATAEPLDPEMDARIHAHKESRPDNWDTLEEPLELATALVPILHRYDTMLLDCLTVWVSNLLHSTPDFKTNRRHIPSDVEALLDVYRRGKASWIIVSNEVGLGLVATTELGRIYTDELGRVNRLVAAEADTVYFMTAGISAKIKG